MFKQILLLEADQPIKPYQPLNPNRSMIIGQPVISIQSMNPIRLLNPVAVANEGFGKVVNQVLCYCKRGYFRYPYIYCNPIGNCPY